MQCGFKIGRTLDFKPLIKSNSVSIYVTERTVLKFFIWFGSRWYYAAQYVPGLLCEAMRGLFVLESGCRTLLAWNHSMPPCCEEGLP